MPYKSGGTSGPFNPNPPNTDAGAVRPPWYPNNLPWPPPPTRPPWWPDKQAWPYRPGDPVPTVPQGYDWGNSGGGGGVTPPPPTEFDQGAFDAMMVMLQQYGLESLGSILKNLILDGVTDQASLVLALQQTQEWKTRFAGNEMLAANGLPMLSVAEYLAVERSYAQILKNYGLPKGFFDDPSDFAKWIGNSVSANELQQRAQTYADIARRETDPAIRDQLVSMGLSEGDIMAYTMDPSRAMPLIQKKWETAKIGGAARRNGVVSDNEYLGHLTDLGVTEQQAMQGYGIIGENLGTLDTLGDIYGEEYGLRDFETEVFEQNGQSAKKRKRLASRERANFSGSSGVGQGSLTRDTSGSY